MHLGNFSFPTYGRVAIVVSCNWWLPLSWKLVLRLHQIKSKQGGIKLQNEIVVLHAQHWTMKMWRSWRATRCIQLPLKGHHNVVNCTETLIGWTGLIRNWTLCLPRPSEFSKRTKCINNIPSNMPFEATKCSEPQYVSSYLNTSFRGHGCSYLYDIQPFIVFVFALQCFQQNLSDQQTITVLLFTGKDLRKQTVMRQPWIASQLSMLTP